MKVDYEKFPDIPPGCQLNYNKNTGLYQVFRESRRIDPETGTKKVVRETIGSIRDGVYRPGENYLLRKKNAELEAEVARLRRLTMKVSKADRQTDDNAEKVETRVAEAIKTSEMDFRRAERTHINMAPIALAALMSALSGDSDAVMIENYLKIHRDFFEKYLPNSAFDNVSHDTIRRAFMLVEPKKFGDFYVQMTFNLIRQTERRIVAADGQAVRASARLGKDGALKGTQMLMNFFDTGSRVCLAHEVIDRKTNEISVGHKMVENLALSGSIVTADAMSCQVNFVNAVMGAQADYLLSLKGNQEACWQEVMTLFGSVEESRIQWHRTGYELAHGRIERREVAILPGALLSKPMTSKWLGLREGSVVRLRTVSTNKRSGQKTDTYSYYITSILPTQDNAGRIYEAIRSHWAIENNLHYMLDVYWNQDRMQASNPTYISNRSTLNKLALAMLEHYRFWLWNTGREQDFDAISIKTLQGRCRKPEVTIECLAAGLGFL